MEENNTFGFSILMLKIIALVAMIIDHIGTTLLQENSVYYWIFCGIGRISFPIFAFVLVEGFIHTKDIKKYILRMGIFAIISEVPFDLLHFGTDYGKWLSEQNIMFTLAIGLVMMFIDMQIKKNCNNDSWVYTAMVVVCAMFATYLLRTDYTYAGVLFIAVFYFFRDNKINKSIGNALLNIVAYGGIQIIGIFSIPFIWFYNNKPGRYKFRYMFYIIYPLHMLIIWVISILLH
ncbi:MAG: TraX family protein [Eubacterium sp.]